MRAHKQKQLNYAAQDRMRYREEIKSEKRAWAELPSVIVELPYRIQHQHWTQFDQLLDSITPNDLAILTQELITHIHIEYHKRFERSQVNNWKNATTFNLARMVLRLRIADNYQIKDFLGFLRDACQAHAVSQGENQPLCAIFKILKQFAIFIGEMNPANQQPQTPFRISEDNQNQLNSLVCKLSLYKKYQYSICENKQVFDEYRIFYILLLSLSTIDFKGFIRAGNIQELFHLIDDSVKHKQFNEISLSIKCLLKLLNVSIEDMHTLNMRVRRSLQILLIEGLEPAKQYYLASQNSSLQYSSYELKSPFFQELLIVLSKCEVETMFNGIELLGQLFLQSDNFIEAVSVTINKKAELQRENTKNENKSIIYLSHIQFITYKQLFLSFMTHLCLQVRLKTFWMLSNILGSEKWFYSYGSAFLYQIYRHQMLNNQSQNASIQNQIVICLLNYMCNLHHDQKALQKLVQVEHFSSQQLQPQNYAANCFIFCLETLTSTLKQCLTFKTKQSQNFSTNTMTFLHRALYALTMLLITTKSMQRQDLRQSILYQIENAHLGTEFEYLLVSEIGSRKEMEQVSPLLEEIVKQLQLERQKL